MKNELTDKQKFIGYSNKSTINYNIVKSALDYLSTTGVEKDYKNLDRTSSVYTIEEVQNLAQEIFSYYFITHNIMQIDEEKILKSYYATPGCTTVSEVYDRLNSIYTPMSMYSLPIELTDEPSMWGKTRKPLPIIKGYERVKNVKIPFSKIKLGVLDELSPATLCHEFTHVQSESNRGYSKNYYNAEIIPLFVEKLVSLKLDYTRQLLRTQERARLGYISELCRGLSFNQKINKFKETEVDEMYTYVYSGLIAEKLFDNYMLESKQKNKDKYIEQIQGVFDGKLTVDDFLNKQGVNINKSTNTEMLKRHL